MTLDPEARESLQVHTERLAKSRYFFTAVTPFLLILVCLSTRASAQQNDPAFYSGMRWRQIGPFRAGRVSAVAGVPGNPAIYYMGTPGGGIWKTVDGGTVWKPIFDQEHVDSIGALAVAPSDPKIIYAGTGDVSNVGGSVNHGKGVYRSNDAGITWARVGLEDSRHIGAIWVDPNNADTVLVAALGHTFAPNAERGVFKTTDGGKTWRRVLYKDDSTGAIDLCFDPSNPKIGYAALWSHIVRPGNPRAMLEGTAGGMIYRTSDAGETWTQITSPVLPSKDVGRIGVAEGSRGERVYAIIAAQKDGGLFRSDDEGGTWVRITTDARIQGSGYFSKVFVDPHNSDIVYVAQTSLYRSTDGGKTFISYKGAPGGDDNHVLWIDPANSNWMILGSDQGATISMDGGKSWSSWYNQPTGQIYHLSTDSRFPYWVYGTQQDSGSIATLSRGDYGAITFLDWDPIGGYEFGYIIPDPADPDLVYAGGPDRGLVRIDRSNRQVVTISPNISRDGDYRTAVNPPLAFSPQDAHVLYEATQFLLETRDSGITWKPISPDLTKRPGSEAEQKKVAEAKSKEAESKKPKTEEEEATTAPPDRTAINTFAVPPVIRGEIWAGTTDGLIQLTRDNGATWSNVSPPGLSRFTLVSLIEASHFDSATAYAAIDDHDSDDFRPHIFRTRDYGHSWQETTTGIPDGSFARAVKEDPVRRGLLYAGTETGTYVSFDDGDHWLSLQLNMPTVSVRDMVIHENDLVIATYGRAFWILDDLAPLRQIAAHRGMSETFLFEPAKAIRMRPDLNQDTPLPPEMPAGDNPPTGAVLDYYLHQAPRGDIALSIYDERGQLVRQFSSKPEPEATEPPPDVPDYWLFRPQPLPKQAGMNRFFWDLRYPSPPAIRHSYPISAVYQNTPGEPQGPLVVPGRYEVRLTVSDHTYKQSLFVELDPRVKSAQADLTRQLELEEEIVNEVTASYGLYRSAADLRSGIAQRQQSLAGKPKDDGEGQMALTALKDLDQKVSKIAGESGGGGFRFGKPKPTFAVLNRLLSELATIVDGSDTAPIEAMKSAYDDYTRDLSKTTSQWAELMEHDLPAVNSELAKLKIAPLIVPSNHGTTRK